MGARARARRRAAPGRHTGRGSRAGSRAELPRRREPDGPARPEREDRMKAVHYLNQFFAGMGGEEHAETPPTRLDGSAGPGKGLQAALADVEIVATLACGDDYFAEHEEEALEELLAWLEAEKPDVVVAGPAFGSGRYGYACARLAAEATGR